MFHVKKYSSKAFYIHILSTKLSSLNCFQLLDVMFIKEFCVMPLGSCL